MSKCEAIGLNRRTLLTGSAVLTASAIAAYNSSEAAFGQQSSAAFDQNTLKRRGVGLRAFDKARASPGFTLFAPVSWQNRNVYLIDLLGKVIQTWNMPYPPGVSGQLTERRTLFYNGRTSEENYLNPCDRTTGAVFRGTESLLTHRWREPDSNHQFRERRPASSSCRFTFAPTSPFAGSSRGDMSPSRTLGGVTRYRWFESGSLQRRVSNELFWP